VTPAAGTAAYPSRPAERDAWIVGRRPARNAVSAERSYAFFTEDEVDAHGIVRRVATIFLTNRECPYRCLMCDLWQNTLEAPVPAGAIVRQIEAALAAKPPAADEAAPTVVKLYNAGSFFDHRAIPPGDYVEIAARLKGFERVIVESHPALVGADVERLRDLLDGELEVAMGLETAHPVVLAQLNKRMTLESYAAAAERLTAMAVASRAFVLVQPPFLREAEAADWAVRSAAFAFDHGAGAVSLIPVRAGNGALDALAAAGDFTPPRLATLEAAFDRALALDRGRVFADTWDLGRFAQCDACLEARAARLTTMNLTQRGTPRVRCDHCESRDRRDGDRQ
jgi:radical SAM enzyme (TIGR01210 family)